MTSKRVTFLLLALSCFLVELHTSAQRTPRAIAEVEGDGTRNDARIGDVSGIAIDPHDAKTFYAAGGQGVFKSTDGGATWKDITVGIAATAFREIVIDPLNSNILYAQTDTTILKSTNSGVSWVSITSGFAEGAFHGLAINPSDSSTLYVEFGHKIFQTTDGGQTWRAIAPEPNEGLFRILVDSTSPQTIYALAKGLSKSTDGGAHWSRIDSDLPKSELNAISLVPSHPSVLYVGTERHGIYKSTNGGHRWFAVASGLIAKNMNEIRGEIPRVRAIAIDPSKPNTLYAGTSANLTGGLAATIFKSTNAGQSWKLLRAIGQGTGPSNINCITVDPFAPSIVLAGIDGDGIVSSADGGLNWSRDDAALSTASIVALSIGKSDGALYAATMQGVYKFGGGRWRQIGSQYKDFDGEWVAALAVDPSNSSSVYAGTRSSADSNYGGVFKTINGGQTWMPVNSGLRYFAVWISALAIDPLNPSYLYAGTYGHGILTSKNGGTTWVPSNSAIERSQRSVEAFAIDPNNSATVYAVTPGFLWKSTDLGSNWSSGTGLPAPGLAAWKSRLTALAIDPSNTSILYAAHYLLGPGGEATIYESTNAGGNWFLIAKASQKVINHLAVDPSDSATLYADNADSGILKSIDDGKSWKVMNSGLPRPTSYPWGSSRTLITGLIVDPIHPATIYISTQGSGIFKSSDGGSSWSSMPIN